MAILRIRNEKGEMQEVLAIRGEAGKDGYTPIKGVDYFDGERGADGKQGEKGADGYTPIKGVDYFDGKDGKQGEAGKDGYTPVKGVDYYTEADKQELINEIGKAETAPAYVIEEAERVALNVLDKQSANTFSFIAFTDAHYLADNENIINGITHAGQGMDLIRKGVHIDFATVLGDNGWCAPNLGTTGEMAINEVRTTNKLIDNALRGIPNFRTMGNHDNLTFADGVALGCKEMFPLYGAYNAGAVFDINEKVRGYCYRDFEEHRLRVICLNTSDDAYINISGKQLQWFAETLDLSSKEDGAYWNILILSHLPLDWDSSTIPAANILRAYEIGSNVSFSKDALTISYDYANKNVASIIANIHGHTHGFKVDYLHFLNSSNEAQATSLKRVAIPNACFSRTNQYLAQDDEGGFGIEYGDSTTYNKEANTAKDTSFCVITVDTKNTMIYADCYGAGIDREIEYIGSVKPIVYENLLTTARDTVNTDIVFNNGLGYMDGKYASSSSSTYYSDDANFFTTGLIEIQSLDDVFYIKNTTFDTAQSHTRLGLITESAGESNFFHRVAVFNLNL